VNDGGGDDDYNNTDRYVGLKWINRIAGFVGSAWPKKK
jgi:hypothetical protein